MHPHLVSVDGWTDRTDRTDGRIGRTDGWTGEQMDGWWMGFHKIVLWCECGLPPAWITPPLPPLGMHNTAALVASAMWAISVVSVVSVISVISVNQSSSFSELSVTASDPNNPTATPA